MTWLMAKIYGGAVAVLVFVAAIFAIRRDAVRDNRKDEKIEDMKNAQDIRRRADTVDKRLREHDDAGWRD
jgi:uncharacterized membrane protein